MGELGELLRQAREQKGLTLDDVQAATYIKRRYLEALEAEQWEQLPHPTVGRGFLANYAAVLDLDVNYVLGLYDQRVLQPARNSGATLTEQGILFKSISMKPPPRVSPDLLIGLVLVLILVGVVGGTVSLYGESLLPQDKIPAVVSSLPTADMAFILPTPTPAPTDTPTPTVTPTPMYYTGVSVELVITEESWVQVLVDGTKTFEGILKAGDRKHWNGERQVAVRVGNAGGVEAIVNGESVGVLGQRGQVLDRVYEKVEDPALLAPTPTATAAVGQ